MKIRKYQLVTCLLVIYAVFMTLYFGLDLLKSGEIARFWITLSAEIIVIILAYFALRKRDRLRKEREKQE
ncbi:MAG: hypothetical protein J1E78_02580 [Muribaculaceae bacterium]|nr:hypothetical protein [Muribaculaceae bacterium]